MSTDTGKSAKVSSQVHPKYARLTDTGRATYGITTFKVSKPFGMQYEYRPYWPKGADWRIEKKWFKTEQQRDYALSRFWNGYRGSVKIALECYRNPEKIL